MRVVVSRACVCATHLLAVRPDEPYRIVGDMLLFRGTVNFHELWTEMRVGSKAWAEVRGTAWRERGDRAGVHRGFADLYLEIRDALLDDVLAGPPIRTVGGHSLGGVFAVLIADELRRAGAAPRDVYTFGSPRVGNRAFARSVNHANVFRVCNTRDPIPQLPPLCRHVGRPITLDFGGRGIETHSLERYRDTLFTERGDA